MGWNPSKDVAVARDAAEALREDSRVIPEFATPVGPTNGRPRIVTVKRRRGRPAKPPQPKRVRKQHTYPWQDWFDGREWTLRKGEHYRLKTRDMRQHLQRVARSRGVRLAVLTTGDGCLIVRVERAARQVP